MKYLLVITLLISFPIVLVIYVAVFPLAIIGSVAGWILRTTSNWLNYLSNELGGREWSN